MKTGRDSQGEVGKGPQKGLRRIAVSVPKRATPLDNFARPPYISVEVEAVLVVAIHNMQLISVSIRFSWKPALVMSAAAFFAGFASQPALAQNFSDPACPKGEVYSGGKCVAAVPAPTCPSGYTFSAGTCVVGAPKPSPAVVSLEGGPWAFIIREVFGVRSATQLDGATFCAVSGTPADAAKDYFNEMGLSAKHVSVDSGPAGIEAYQKGRCDVLVVSDRAASTTASKLKPSGAHMLLPEKFGEVAAAPKKATAPAPVPAVPAPAPDTTVQTPTPPADIAYSLQAELKRIGCLTGKVDGDWGGKSRVALRRFSQLSGKPLGSDPSQAALSEAQSRPAGYCPPVKAVQQPRPPVKRKRCSAIKYAYTRGNTCACAGGLVFNGSRCVRRF
jgi:hypothetical protein